MANPRIPKIFKGEKNAVFDESNIIFNLPLPPLWEGP